MWNIIKVMKWEPKEITKNKDFQYLFENIKNKPRSIKIN